MEIWIRVAATQGGKGLWDVETKEPLDPRTLPITDALKVRFIKWMRRYRNLPGGKGALDTFAADGLAIAKALKAELPVCIVNYYDLAAEARNTEDDFPRDDQPDPWDDEVR